MAKGKLGLAFTIIAGIGLVITVMMTAKKAPQAQEMKTEALKQKRLETGDENAQLTKMETIQAQLPCYAPVAASALLTVGSLVGSQIFPQEALRDLKKMHETYKEITAKVNGPKAEALIEKITEQKALPSGVPEEQQKKETFVIRFDNENIVFESTIVDILMAEYDVNRFFAGTGEITFNQMLKIFHIDREFENGDLLGWSLILGDTWYGYNWIDFEHRRGTLNGKQVYFIDMPFECHSLCEEG